MKVFPEKNTSYNTASIEVIPSPVQSIQTFSKSRENYIWLNFSTICNIVSVSSDTHMLFDIIYQWFFKKCQCVNSQRNKRLYELTIKIRNLHTLNDDDLTFMKKLSKNELMEIIKIYDNGFDYYNKVVDDTLSYRNIEKKRGIVQ